MSIGERLRFIRDNRLKLSRKNFIEGLNVSARTLESYENNETSPDANFLGRVWRKYHAELTPGDLNWLIDGERREEAGPPPEDYAHIPLYDVQASAGGGAYIVGEEVTDILAFRKEWISNELRVGVKDLSVILVDGDSMAPTLNPGDIMLIVKQDGEPTRDGIYVVRLDDTLLVKRLQRLPGRKIKVTSDNPSYEPYTIDTETAGKDFVIIGRVVWAGRRF